ncbi:hypothetical protein C8A05DRAFT_16342 [Staphylotrichum tortipilum]|uniref:Mediator of RNA polymerase II transcription subunit 16 n=1 Tax=Staphylotrichum tortipilum TaxID=2831512 RepID=A0AAN6MJR3_9PEZI|nr:hypothetical protein C8A05DRAFT_16342 [Staphylotrichum longicolle]
MSAHDMALLHMEGGPMNVDGSIQDIGGIGGIGGLGGIGGMADMADMGAMGDLDPLGGAMALDDVDLFGDPVMDDALAALPAHPPPSKQLLQRLDDMRTRGCCQAIAWSRQGTIASIAKDGMSIELRYLRCNPHTTEWELSEPSSWSPPAPSPPPSGPNPPATASLASATAPFVHLVWAPTGNPDLAVVDALGRVTILSLQITVNQTYPVRRWETDVVDDLHAIVGCYWLPLGSPQNKQFHLIYGPATKTPQAEYRYEHRLYPAVGPWHPNPAKSAFLCVTTNGALKLFFTQNNARVEETAIELESVTSSDDLITHASICSDNHALLIALATASKQLRIVRVAIQWGIPQVDKQVPAGSVPLRPSLRETHVALGSWLQPGPGGLALDASMALLSHIEILPSAQILPSAPPGHPQPMAPAVVLTVRSYTPQDASSYNQESQSIIDRWEVLTDQPLSLHPAFQQLGVKSNAQPTTVTRLRKLDPIVLDKVVVTVTTAQFGRVLCFAFSDGTVQFRDRFTMDEIYHEPSTNTIMHPLQVGFQFVNDTPCLQAAFSPTTCSFTQICEDLTVKWNRPQYPLEDPSAELPAGELNPLFSIGLSVPMSSTGVIHATCDDVLAMARQFGQKPEFAYAWVREMVAMLKIAVDYSEDAHHDQLVRNTLLQLCFGVLNHLGFRGDFQPRSRDAKFASLAMGVRNMFVVITVANNIPPGIKEKLNPLDDPEVVDTVTGCTKWGISLLAWLTDSLFGLLDDPEIMTMLTDHKRFPELAKYLQSKNNVSLQLLLCSSTRGFLLAACRRLIQVEGISNRAAHYYEAKAQQQQQQQQQQGVAAAANAGSRPHSALYQAYQRMARAISTSLVKVPDFDRLLSDLGSDIQAAYQKTLSGLNAAKMKPQHAALTEQQQQQLNEQFVKKAQGHCELDMLLGRNPPPSFREVLHKLFTVTLPAFRNQTDPAKLYFADYDVLEMEDNPVALAARKATGKYVDVFKRVELVVGPQRKKTGRPKPPKPPNADEANSNKGPYANGLAGMLIYGTWTGIGGNSSAAPQWRRCVRCGAVMADLWSGKPGYNFVLTQQRKCVCGGSWGTEPRGS